MAQTGRRCSICAHPSRAVLEAAVLGSDEQAVSPLPSLPQIAAQYGVGVASVRRHLRNHAAPAVREALEPREGADAATVVGRALAVANAVRSIRAAALLDGDRRDVIRAADAEVRALALLGARLGVNAESTARDLAEAHRLAQAVRDVARADPAVGDALARGLEARGANELADALRTQYQRRER